MTYRKQGKNAAREAAMHEPPGPPIAWEYGLPVSATPWDEAALPPPMPWWYPLMHFEAAVGRAALAEARRDQQG